MHPHLPSRARTATRTAKLPDAPRWEEPRRLNDMCICVVVHCIDYYTVYMYYIYIYT